MTLKEIGKMNFESEKERVETILTTLREADKERFKVVTSLGPKGCGNIKDYHSTYKEMAEECGCATYAIRRWFKHLSTDKYITSWTVEDPIKYMLEEMEFTGVDDVREYLVCGNPVSTLPIEDDLVYKYLYDDTYKIDWDNSSGDPEYFLRKALADRPDFIDYMIEEIPSFAEVVAGDEKMSWFDYSRMKIGYIYWTCVDPGNRTVMNKLSASAREALAVLGIERDNQLRAYLMLGDDRGALGHDTDRVERVMCQTGPIDMQLKANADYTFALINEIKRHHLPLYKELLQKYGDSLRYFTEYQFSCDVEYRAIQLGVTKSRARSMGVTAYRNTTKLIKLNNIEILF